jgi:NADH-quinone oxidoreductase subunit L
MSLFALTLGLPLGIAMIDAELVFEILGLIVVTAPFVLVAVLGISSLIGLPFSERAVGRFVQACVLMGLIPSLIILAMMLALNTVHVPIELGSWVVIPHYHFAVKFVFDRLSVPFVILSFALCGTIGAFANKYMHREKGFNRFFVLYAIFLLGMVWTSLAGTIETLFGGWELVGLSSALLVAFFHERSSPVRNGLRVWTVYRISDAALLLGSVVLHHVRGGGDFDKLLNATLTPWPDGQAVLTHQQAVAVGLLFLVAAAGKSALVPFSNWLPRAMEGPTPSSAVFYGALSVHLGAFLLLRISPILAMSTWLSATVVALGLTTAAYSAFAGRVQSDIKCALSYASLAQVGLIVAEIGMGWQYVALVHILGHGCLRTLQFLRAPTLLHDYRILENAIGEHLPRGGRSLESRFPDRLRVWLYRLAIERGYLDAFLTDYLVRPFLGILRACDAAERRWTDFLSGRPSRESDADPHSPGSLEDLL